MPSEQQTPRCEPRRNLGNTVSRESRRIPHMHENEQMHGFRSIIQENRCGAMNWTTSEGEIVRVTMVNYSSNYYGREYPDMVYVGSVVGFVERVSYGIGRTGL